MTLDEKKKDAELFLSEQIEKLDVDQKKQLSYVLLGATMAGGLLGPGKETSTGESHDR